MSLSTSSATLIESNRRNAQLSTGPRTAAGKARVSRNAVSHGLFAKTLILTGEDPAELEALRQSIREDLRPVTETEALIVERIVVATWKLRRVAAAEQAVYELEGYADLEYLRDDRRKVLGLELETEVQVDDDSVATVRPKLPGHVVMAMSFRGKDPLEKVQLHEQRLENSIHRNLRQLRDLRKSRGETTPSADTPLWPIQADLSDVLPPDSLAPTQGGEEVATEPSDASPEPYDPIESEFDESNPNPTLSPENQRPLTPAQLEAQRAKEARRQAKLLEILRKLAFPPEPRSKKSDTQAKPSGPVYFAVGGSDNLDDFDEDNLDFLR